MVIRIYFEGGRHLRESFADFFKDLHTLARARRGRVQLISCKATAVQDFMTALAVHRDEFVVALLDCEGPPISCSMEALRNRFRAVWRPPAGVTIGDDRVFRMTQVMESWFLADRECLRRYYGQGFRETALPGHVRIEEAPKDDVIQGLKNATRDTARGAYKKGSHDKDILRKLDPTLVRAASPECDRIFTTLNAVITAVST